MLNALAVWMDDPINLMDKPINGALHGDPAVIIESSSHRGRATSWVSGPPSGSSHFTKNVPRCCFSSERYDSSTNIWAKWNIQHMGKMSSIHEISIFHGYVSWLMLVLIGVDGPISARMKGLKKQATCAKKSMPYMCKSVMERNQLLQVRFDC